MEQTLEFQNETRRIGREALVDSLEAAKTGSAPDQLRVAAAMAWVAFSCPEAIDAVYDNIASIWLGEGGQPEVVGGLPEARLDSDFWEKFWAMIGKPRDGFVPSGFQTKVMDMALASTPDFIAVAERYVKSHPNVGTVLATPVRDDLDPAALGACPENSLGRTLHEMIVGHGYSQAIVDFRLSQLSSLPESLLRVNSCLVKMHRPWNLVAGYDTGDSHQIAYGGFQLAQFGLNHAAMALASFATISCLYAPTAFYILLYLVSEGWRHGQETPAFMEIDWDSEWVHSVDTIRKRHGITPFRSVFSRNLFEVFGTPRD